MRWQQCHQPDTATTLAETPFHCETACASSHPVRSGSSGQIVSVPVLTTSYVGSQTLPGCSAARRTLLQVQVRHSVDLRIRDGARAGDQTCSAAFCITVGELTGTHPGHEQRETPKCCLQNSGELTESLNPHSPAVKKRRGCV